MVRKVSLAMGGTGGNTAANARQQIGIGPTTIAAEIAPLAIAKGGTASTIPADARSNLGLGSISVEATPLAIAKGGTASTIPADARSNLGLGSISVEATPLAVNKGGTGGVNAANAKINLGLDELIFSGTVGSPSIKVYPIIPYAPYRMNVNQMHISTESGNCSIDLEINGTDITGLTNKLANSTKGTFTATGANVVSVGDTVYANVIANNSSVDFGIVIRGIL